MARTSKKDWWETFLWLGVFLLVLAFLYQLLKLVNQATGAAAGIGGAISGALASIPQALANTAGAAEGFLTGLVMAPMAAISSLFSGFPTLLSWMFGLIEGILAAIAGGTIAGPVSAWNSGPVSSSTGYGSTALVPSYNPTVNAPGATTTSDTSGYNPNSFTAFISDGGDGG
jgi:hypothetical protein